MSFAYKLTPAARRAVPAVSHFDGTARVQTVAESDDPWLHALLLEIGRRTGYPVLINTSFNTRGRPITNLVSEALSMLNSMDELDCVLIEDSNLCCSDALYGGRKG